MSRIVDSVQEANSASSNGDHLELSSFEMSKKMHVFAVGLQQPMFKHLQLYGFDGGPCYFWNCMGQMGSTLHEGHQPAIREALGEGGHVYVFDSPEEALLAAQSTQDHATPAETISLYGCAVTLYEDCYGSESLEFGRVCWSQAEFAKLDGNDGAYRGYGGMALEIFKKQLGVDHPETIAVSQHLQQQLQLFSEEQTKAFNGFVPLFNEWQQQLPEVTTIRQRPDWNIALHILGQRVNPTLAVVLATNERLRQTQRRSISRTRPKAGVEELRGQLDELRKTELLLVLCGAAGIIAVLLTLIPGRRQRQERYPGR